MKKTQYIYNSGVLLIGLLFFLTVETVFWNKQAQSDASPASDSIRILTVNLLFSEVVNRDNRLRAIADWVANNGVDVLLLQEVVKGLLANTDSSAGDLQNILSEVHGLNFHMYTETETAVPNLLKVGNSILSRHAMEAQLARRLPEATEEQIFGIYNFKLVRNVILAVLKSEGFPAIHVYNTHLCAGCESHEHESQLDELLDFVMQVESNSTEVNPVVLGGDFNIDRINKGDVERSFYDKIISAGFNDAYATSVNEHLDSLCEDEDRPDQHCTIGASDLSDGKARRIDYIFTRGFRGVRESRVVFSSALTDEPSVSDHSAVLTVLEMPYIRDPGLLQLHIPLLLLKD